MGGKGRKFKRVESASEPVQVQLYIAKEKDQHGKPLAIVLVKGKYEKYRYDQLSLAERARYDTLLKLTKKDDSTTSTVMDAVSKGVAAVKGVVSSVGKHVTNTVYGEYKAHGVITIVAEDGTETDVPAVGYQSDWEWFTQQHPASEDQKIRLLAHQVPKDCVREKVKVGGTGNQWRYGNSGVLMCLYDATKQYLEAHLGCKFSKEDEDFYRHHPLVEKDGAPMQHTLHVVQELIAPYGLRISRVQLQPNLSIKGDLRQWRSVLGINPMALTDQNTNNAQYHAHVPADTADYRFEYSERALRPAVACGLLTGGSASGITGSTGGHAVYVPPRRGASGAMLSFQIDREDRVPWKKLPVFPEVEIPAPPPPELEFSLWAYKNDVSKRPNGTTTVSPATEHPAATVSVRDDDDDVQWWTTTDPVRGSIKHCVSCDTPLALAAINPSARPHPALCIRCWNVLLEHWRCRVCKNDLSATGKYVPGSLTASLMETAVQVECLACNAVSKLQTADKVQLSSKQDQSAFAGMLDFLVFDDNGVPHPWIDGVGGPPTDATSDSSDLPYYADFGE